MLSMKSCEHKRVDLSRFIARPPAIQAFLLLLAWNFEEVSTMTPKSVWEAEKLSQSTGREVIFMV